MRDFESEYNQLQDLIKSFSNYSEIKKQVDAIQKSTITSELESKVIISYTGSEK